MITPRRVRWKASIEKFQLSSLQTQTVGRKRNHYIVRTEPPTEEERVRHLHSHARNMEAVAKASRRD